MTQREILRQVLIDRMIDLCRELDLDGFTAIVTYNDTQLTSVSWYREEMTPGTHFLEGLTNGITDVVKEFANDAI